MSGKFNVFDEWGNKVGEYTPTGGSGVDGLLMIVAMIFLWTIGFLIYTFFRLIGQGIKEVKLGNWSKAVGYLIFPMILVVVMTFLYISETVIAPKVREQQFQKIDQKARDDAKFLDSNPVDILITKEYGYLSVEFENNWKNPVKVNSLALGTTSSYQYAYRSTTGQNGPIVVPPGSKIVIKYLNNYSYENTISATTSLCVSYEFVIDNYDRIIKYSLISGHSQKYCQDL